MSVDFNRERWDKLRESYSKWWDNTLERPIVSAVIFDDFPQREQPDAPCLSQQCCADFSYTPDELIDRLDYELSSLMFLGDSFPRVNLSCFGPGVMAAFLGARIDNSSGAVWFYPPENAPNDIADLHFEYEPNNKWLCRIKDICAAAMKRWQGNVLVSMPDVGMGLDTLASFRGTEQLCIDLYDSPQEVQRLMRELDTLWFKFYREIDEVLQPMSPGYSDWAGLYCEKPFYTLQSDFSYMISTSMFDDFTKPWIASQCRQLSHSIYHLDGVGQLPHLDSLLAIPELDGIQWIPGDGKPDCKHWPEVYKKIHAAGKKIQLLTDLETFEVVGEQVGDYKNICVCAYLGYHPKPDEVAEKLKEFGL